MSTNVNFTASIDRGLLKRAKVLAAKSETSVNALFNAELRYLVETFETAEETNNENFRTLLDFALGRIEDLSAMESLGLDSEEDLFLLMAQARLPMPRLSDAVVEGMVDELNRLSR
jgi:ribosome assembly protein YihI (activator of Der GTPase)